MKKKMVMILLAMSMSVSLFSGCGQDAVESKKSEEATKTFESEKTEEMSSEESKEIPTLRVFSVEMDGNPNDLNDNATIKYLEGELGIDLEIETVPSDVLNERITLAITSNDLPDIFYFPTSVAMDSADLLKYGQNGVFQPIDEILEESFPNLYSFLTENTANGVEVLYESDGHIYSTPNIMEPAHMKHTLKTWVNQMFLDALNMDIPETLEEYEAYLKGVVENDVNGNGDPNDEVGIVCVGGNSAWYRFIMNSFVYTPYVGANGGYDVALYIDNATGEVMCSNVQDGYREGLRYINSLWEQGLVYEETLTMSKDQVTTLYMSEEPVIGSLSYFAPFLYDSTFSTPTYSQLRILPPLANNGMKGISPWNDIGELQITVGGGIITSACENVEAAARFLDYHYTVENTRLLNYGPDYETSGYITLAKDGELNLLGEQAFVKSGDPVALKEDNHSLMNWQIRFSPREVYFETWFDDSQGLYSSSGSTAVLQRATDVLSEYETDEYSTISTYLRLPEESTQIIGDIKTQLNNYVAQWDTEFIMGTKSLDDDWDEYVDGLYELGLQTIIDEYQVAVDK